MTLFFSFCHLDKLNLLNHFTQRLLLWFVLLLLLNTLRRKKPVSRAAGSVLGTVNHRFTLRSWKHFSGNIIWSSLLKKGKNVGRWSCSRQRRSCSQVQHTAFRPQISVLGGSCRNTNCLWSYRILQFVTLTLREVKKSQIREAETIKFGNSEILSIFCRSSDLCSSNILVSYAHCCVF